MIIRGRLGAAYLLTATALAAGLTGCGGGETKAACERVTAEFTRMASAGMAKIGDPTALKAEYDSSAAKIREAAKGTDIADEADKVAAAYQKLGQQVADFAANPSTTPPNLDQASLIQAGADLKQACS